MLGHKDGLVDAEYVAKSGDPRYRVGQRLVIGRSSVKPVSDLVERLAAELTALVP
jgi:DNA-binding IclR family transcriptional regulator